MRKLLFPLAINLWIQEHKNIGVPKTSKKDLKKNVDFLTKKKIKKKSKLLAMLNQCKTPKELTIISGKIANLA